MSQTVYTEPLTTWLSYCLIVLLGPSQPPLEGCHIYVTDKMLSIEIWNPQQSLVTTRSSSISNSIASTNTQETSDFHPPRVGVLRIDCKPDALDLFALSKFRVKFPSIEKLILDLYPWSPSRKLYLVQGDFSRLERLTLYDIGS